MNESITNCVNYCDKKYERSYVIQNIGKLEDCMRLL